MKKPKEHLIKSVLDDLKNETADPSFRIGPEGLGDSNDAYSSQNENEAVEDGPLDLAFDPPRANLSSNSKSSTDADDDKTSVIGDPEATANAEIATSQAEEHKPMAQEDRTVIAAPKSAVVEPKISYGGGKVKSSAFESQFAQADHLKLAQQRVLDLEREIERLRKDNEVLSSAGEISKSKLEELIVRAQNLEKQREDLRELNDSELRIFKDGLLAKDAEIHRLRNKVEELESRLSNDLRKVRVRERELENRLELSKAEKAALLKTKDETILELKRKTDSLQNELESYQNRIIDLGQKLEANQEQFARTVRALRIALTNLEVNDSTNTAIRVAPLKKAD